MIRIRHPEGTCTFKLEQNSTLASLQAFISSECGIAASDQELKLGYPPKALHRSSIASSTLLSAQEVGITNGEQVIVSRKQPASSSSAPTASSAPSSASARYGASPTSSFGPMSGPKPIVSTATGTSGFGLGARRLNDGLTARPPAAAASSSSSAPGSTTVTDGSISVPLASGQGSLTLKMVPDDNSCLFASVSFLISQSLDSVSELRNVVADAIRSDPDKYPEVVLGQPREAYITKILSPNAWGGAIELSILSHHFGLEIDSIDVATRTIHRFGEDKKYPNRALVVYSGIHYDALYLKGSGGQVTSVFPNLTSLGLEEEEDEVVQAATSLCNELKRRRYYTDTANFSLKCKQCGKGLRGEREAVQHAKTTGHGEFGEV